MKTRNSGKRESTIRKIKKERVIVSLGLIPRHGISVSKNFNVYLFSPSILFVWVLFYTVCIPENLDQFTFLPVG